MKHIKYLPIILFLLSFTSLQAQTLFIESENITLTEGSQLFIDGSLQAENDASITSENETAITTFQIGNQLISQTIPFATAEGTAIPLALETQVVSDNSRISASTYPTNFENFPLPSTVENLLFNEEDIALETLNRFWILTLTELTTTATFTFTTADLTGNEANEEKLQLIFHNGNQWVHIDSGSSDGVGSNSYTATISQSGVYALFAGDISLCAAGDIDQDGICDDVDDCIGEAILFSLSETICEGEEFEGFTESGTFTDTFTAESGCDSTRTLELTVLPNILNELEVSICEGEEFEGFTESGIFEDVFTASNGCDSTRILQLEVVAEIRNEIEATICEGEEFEGFSESGTFEDTFVSAGGCDSTRILQLEVLPHAFSEVQTTICEGEEFEGFTEAGTFETILVSSNGCDSIRTVTLEIAPLVELADTAITDDTGGGTGTIEVILNGNVEDFTFEWSNGSTDANIGGLEFGIYTVTITDQFDCTAEFEFEVELNTSIEGKEFVPLQIAPNPTQANIWLQIPFEFQRTLSFSAQLLNLQGQLVKTWSLSNTQQQELSLLEVNPGIYLLQIQEKEAVYFAKIVKM